MILSQAAMAQTDTLKEIQTLLGQKKFMPAERLMSQYVLSHQDAPSLWYYASVAHWAGDNKEAAVNFQKALDKEPSNTKLRLDYARMLFETEKLNASQKQLDRVLKEDEKNVEAHLIKGNIDFWYGRIRHANADIKTVTDQYPDNTTAANLKLAISQSTAPYLKYSVGYLNDDQPMQAVVNTVEAGMYYSWLLSPQVRIVDQDFYAAGRWNPTLWASVSNKFLFGKAGMDISLSAGVFKNFRAGADWTGDAVIHQKLYRSLSLQLEAERRPYLSTLSSTSLSLMQHNLSAALIVDGLHGWTAQAAYRYQFYNDHNPIQTAYAWVLSQPVKVSVFQFRFGYGYNFSTSAQSRFTATKTAAEVLANYATDPGVSGVYSPYFTPMKQHTHSAIVSIGIKPAKFVSIGIKADVGFYAQAQNPYLYLDEKQADGYFINSGFSKEVSHPYKLSANIDFKIGEKITLGADYAYTSGFFYANHYTSLHLNISFLKHAGR